MSSTRLAIAAITCFSRKDETMKTFTISDGALDRILHHLNEIGLDARRQQEFFESGEIDRYADLRPNWIKASLKAIGKELASIQHIGEEWSGSPDPKDPDNFWIDDVTGERVNAATGERS
jgi:hypothetical protein